MTSRCCSAAQMHRGGPTAASAEPELTAGEVQQNLLRATADRHDAHLAVDSLDLVAADEGGASQHLGRLASNLLEGTCRLNLEEREVGRPGQLPDEAPRTQIDVGLGCVYEACHVGELAANHLMLAELPAKGFALGRPGSRLFEAHAGVRAALMRGVQPLGVEVLEDPHEYLVLGSNEVPGGHLDVVEVQRGGVSAVPTHLLERRTRESAHVLLEQHQRYALETRSAGAHCHGEVIGAHAGADEGLRAVDDVVIAATFGARAQSRDVRAAAR